MQDITYHNQCANPSMVEPSERYNLLVNSDNQHL